MYQVANFGAEFHQKKSKKMLAGSSDIVLSVVVINYKTPTLTIKCLESVYGSTFKYPFEVLVIDNDSQDSSKEQIVAAFPQIKWIQNTYNAGFGRANNLAIESAEGSIILLLNSDVILLADTLEIAVDEFKKKKPVVLGCQLMYPDGSPQNSKYFDVATIYSVLRKNLVVDYLFKPKAKHLNGVMGSFMMFRKDHFQAVGGFDPDFFMYAEELDLCKRMIKKFGASISVCEEARAFHIHGASSSNEEWKHRQAMTSNSLLYLKQGGIVNFLALHWVLIFNQVTSFLLLWKMDKQFRADYWKEVRFYWKNRSEFARIPLNYSSKMGSKTGQFLKVEL